MIHPKVLNYLRGDLTKKTMLLVLLPLILISYFGILGLAVWLYPEPYDWRYLSISKLLYPRTNPEFHYIASTSVAVSGVLMIPFAGYIRRRLSGAAPTAAIVGAVVFFGGCICLTLAGLIASHPAHGTSRLPKLHEILARFSVIGIGVGNGGVQCLRNERIFPAVIRKDALLDAVLWSRGTCSRCPRSLSPWRGS